MSVDLAQERKKLVAFLTKYDAEKVSLADDLLKKFAAEGKPGITKMWQSLIKRYNVQMPAGKGAETQAVASPLAPPPAAAAASPKTPAAGKTPAAAATPAAAKTPAASAKKAAATPKKEASPKKSAAAEKPAAEASPVKRKNSVKKDTAASSSAAQGTAAAAAGVDKAAEVEQQRARLQRYFTKYMPDKIGQVDAIVTKISSTDKNGEGWANMWKAFTSRFGPEDVPAEESFPPTNPQAHVPTASQSAVTTSQSSPSGPPSSFQTHPRQLSVASLDSKALHNQNSSGTFTASRLEDDNAGEGSMPSRADALQRRETDNAIREEWVQRISRYMSHYDAAKSDDDIRSAIVSAESSPNGMQELWETLVEHYGPEPPQPISTMLKVMDAQKRSTPQQVAKSLISGDANSAAQPRGPLSEPHGKSRSMVSDGVPVGAATPAHSGQPQKKKAWYLDDDAPGQSSGAGGGPRAIAASSQPFKDAASTGKLVFTDGNGRSEDVNHVGANALIIYGVLRLIGIQYDLYSRAAGPAQHQFIRAIEQEISFNIDCEPSAVVVRRLIPNVAIDFKIDLSAAVQSGTTDRRTAQRIGDILVNRVLNGTFSLRLIRDSYRRDLGGIPSDVFTQSCAVFGSESQQYYTLVPDEAPTGGASVTAGYAVSPGDRNYAAVAAAPISRNMLRKDIFGSSPSPNRQHNFRPGTNTGPNDDSVEQFASKVHHLMEQDRVQGGANRGGAPADLTERWLAGVRPPPNAAAASRNVPAASQRIGNGASGDFGTRMWDDAASELGDFQRREETAQYDTEKPEPINSALSWNRILSGFEDAATSRARKHEGQQYVPYNPHVHEGFLHSGDYGPMPRGRTSPERPSQLDLRGLQRIRAATSSGNASSPPTGIFGGGLSPAQRQSMDRRSPQRFQAGADDAAAARREHRARGGSPSIHQAVNRNHLSPVLGAKSRQPFKGPVSLVEPPVSSSGLGAASYKGFGHAVPAIRSQAEGFFGGMSGRDDSGNYMEREGRRMRALDHRSPAGYQSAFRAAEGAHPAWPTDEFSRDFNNIVRSSQ